MSPNSISCDVVGIIKANTLESLGFFIVAIKRKTFFPVNSLYLFIFTFAQSCTKSRRKISIHGTTANDRRIDNGNQFITGERKGELKINPRAPSRTSDVERGGLTNRIPPGLHLCSLCFILCFCLCKLLETNFKKHVSRL